MSKTPRTEEQKAARRAKLAFWTKLLGVLIIAGEGSAALYKSSEAADADAVREAVQTNFQGALETQTEVESLKEQLATLRAEVNQATLHFSKIIVDLAHQQPGYRGIEMPDSYELEEDSAEGSDEPPPTARRPRRLNPAAQQLQNKIDELGPIELKPMPKAKRPPPKARKAAKKMEQLLEAF